MRAEIVLLVLVALALAGSAWASRGSNPAEIGTLTMRVTQGQTLWSLAQDHPVPGLTTAETADLIARMNGLGGGALHTGMLVEVPARDTCASALASR